MHPFARLRLVWNILGLVPAILLAAAPGHAASPAASPSVATALPAAVTDTVWTWPLERAQKISRGFVAPPTRFAAGHRGIDLPASRADPVHAPSAGVVSFAGNVAGRPVISIAHPGDLVSSFEPVLAGVTEGDPVTSGAVIGAVASGGHCDAACLHFGVRLRGAYVSPLLYLAGVPRAVLLPLSHSGR